MASQIKKRNDQIVKPDLHAGHRDHKHVFADIYMSIHILGVLQISFIYI